VDKVLQACRGQVGRLQEYGTCGHVATVDAMSQSSPDHGLRPVAAQPFEPTTRFPSPSRPSGTGPENRAVLFPETDPDEPQPEKRGVKRFAKPVIYVACALAGAVLVTAIYGLIGPRLGSGSRGGAGSAPAGSAVSDTTVLDRRADTLTLAVSAFDMRARMFDTRRMGCPGLARGLQQVEDGWLAYNIARKDLLAGTDPARDARDKSLYADVRAVEVRFERSSCARP
jgi:hypothetical protein